jgi:hypothetical protein
MMAVDLEEMLANSKEAFFWSTSCAEKRMFPFEPCMLDAAQVHPCTAPGLKNYRRRPSSSTEATKNNSGHRTRHRPLARREKPCRIAIFIWSSAPSRSCASCNNRTNTREQRGAQPLATCSISQKEKNYVHDRGVGRSRQVAVVGKRTPGSIGPSWTATTTGGARVDVDRSSCVRPCMYSLHFTSTKKTMKNISRIVESKR